MNDKTKITGIALGKLFEATISDISNIRKKLDFTGDVDLGVTLNTTLEDKRGTLLVPFKGNDTKSLNIEIKLATRIHLSEIENTIPFIYKGDLHLGEKGPNVKELQKKLNQLLNLSLVVDGVYGNNTANAVRAFKCIHGITSGKSQDKSLDEVTGKLIETLSLR